MTTCSVTSCEKPTFCRGLCRADYARWGKRRDAGWPEPIDPREPMLIGRPRYSDEERRAAADARRLQRNQVSSKRARDKNRPYVLAAKDVPCADCKARFPYVCMDFDHRPGEEKLFNISQAGTASLEALQAEMAKCDVVCSNCHRIRSARRMGIL